MPVEALAVALLLSVVNAKLVDYIVEPVRKRYPDVDLWWVIYVALGTGAVIGWFGEVNLFVGYARSLLLGRILTSLLVGGGASLIHDIFDKQS